MPNYLFTPTPNDAAIRFLQEKPVVSREVFDGLLPELKARAFTVAGVDNMSALQKLRERVATLPAGADWDAIKGEIATELSPFLSGDAEKSQRRAELLLRTHGYQAYAAGQYRTLTAQSEVFPYWEYDSADDGQVRASHAALDGKVFPANADFWKSHFPPWEFGCRCNVIARTIDDVEEIQLEEKQARTPLEARRVITGDRLRRAEQEGKLTVSDNGIPRQVDVRSPQQKFGGSGYSFDPSSLGISIDSLRSRYAKTPQVWEAFETWARRALIGGQNRTVWDWLESSQSGAA